MSNGQWLRGDWQQPENRWSDQPGSIHNDAVAKRVGMRGGTIPGTIHLGHFVPMIEELFGDRWWHNGTISMYYTYATTHREDVRAVVKQPDVTNGDDVRLDAYVETPSGTVVCKGSVSVGRPAEPAYVRSLTLESAPQGANRILKGLAADMPTGVRDRFVFEGDDVAGQVQSGAIRNPAVMYSALNAGFPRDSIAQPAVGFFGATEIVLHRGPIEYGVPYRKAGRVVCVGASPKTEFAWVDSTLHAANGTLVAEMRHLTRWMKVSSSLWAEP
jgi:hypothetical protein